MKQKIAISISAMAIVALCLASCSKNSTPSASPLGTVYFRLHTTIDSVVADSVAPYYYTDSLGRRLSLQVPQFFISNVVLQNTNGGSYTISAYILKSLDSETYLVGYAPVGTYSSVSFTVGLDAVTNALAPSSFSPTGYQPSASMWYDSTASGYMAMKVQGLYDTTAAHTGVNPINFSFEIPNSMEQTVTLARGSAAYPDYSIANGVNQYIDINCDYGKLLSVLNLKTQYVSDGISVNVSIASMLAPQIPGMFRYNQ